MNHSNQSKISMHTSSWTPFDDPIPKNPAQSKDGDVDLLPATYRFGRLKDQVTVARPDLDFLETELSVEKLNFVNDWMWFVGRPMPPRPLHRQVLLSRSIVVTEEMDLHLVWTARQKIYLKPIPQFLLSPDFWSSRILCPGTAQYQCANPDREDCKQRQKLVRCALGFLFSYAALIAYESDYRIAQNEGLLPREVTWPAWRKFVKYLLENHTYASVNPRYHYGELRLGRLNKIYRYRYGHLWGYTGTTSYNLYAQFFQDNLANLAAFLGYVVIILTALQVGLATDQLQPSSAFQAFSYGFTIFSIVAPIFVTVAILIIFIVAYLVNCYITKSYHKKRFREIENSRLDGAKLLE
ncbi:uncharacterized protein BKA78DRAFT_350550 [Phyllosticta capitalensis]|uniref:uncharacterized protein n=1 Tax=Phyllosticta capitalensis TaxID=121624 RepID=UPI003131EC31